MKKLLLASALLAGVAGVSTVSFADTARMLVPAFGPAYETKMGDHMMHMQIIQDGNGQNWVVLPMEDAEMAFGSLKAMTPTKLK
jgi:hypothetical protein